MFQHSDRTGVNEHFSGLPEGTEHVCQRMSDDLVNQMSYVWFGWDPVVVGSHSTPTEPEEPIIDPIPEPSDGGEFVIP